MILPVKYESWLTKFLQGRKTEAYVMLQEDVNLVLRQRREDVFKFQQQRRNQAKGNNNGDEE